MFYLYFTLFCFFLFSLYFYKIGSKIAFILSIIHFFSILLGLFLISIPFLQYRLIKINFEATFVFIFFTSIYLLSISKFEKIIRNINNLDINYFHFQITSKLLIIINLFPTLGIISIIKRTFMFSTIDLKQNIIFKTFNTNNFIESISFNFIGYFSDTYIFCILFYFIGIIKFPKSRLNNFLILSSFSTIASGSLVGGRTQIIYWLLSFFILLIIFKYYIFKDKKFYINKFTKILFISLLLIFTSFTITRFNKTYNKIIKNSELFSIVEYSGQSFLNFNYYVSEYRRKSYTIGRIFPYTNDLLFKRFDLSNYRKNLNIYIGNFPTFLGDLYVDIGIFGLFIFTLTWFLFLFFFTSLIVKDKFLIYLMPICIIIMLPIKGFFYYPYHNKTAINHIWFCILILLLFSITNGKYNNNKL